MKETGSDKYLEKTQKDIGKKLVDDGVYKDVNKAQEDA